MSISAALVKELRDRTGAGMMECKKALAETQGNMDTAIEYLRKNSLVKAEKRAGKAAAEGLIIIKSSSDNKTAIIVEVNCETDFVAKGDDFNQFAEAVAKRIIAAKPTSREALLAMPLNDGNATTVEAAIKTLTAQIGEKIDVRRFEVIKAKGTLGSYMHGTRIGVVVDIEGGSEDLRKDVAMHVAASRPTCVREEQVSADLIAKEKEIYTAQAQDSGKPADIIEKMVMGKVKKFLKDITLLGQPFVKNPDQTIEQLVKAAKADVKDFVCLVLGEGIEKKTEDFAAEVMAQVKK